jgi:hypothetical protein
MEITEIFLSTFDFEIDPTWHEFESVEYSDEVANSDLTISEFITIVKGLS